MLETKVNNSGVLVASIRESDRLNVAVADKVKMELTAIVSEENKKVLLDLGTVKFIDSTGIGVLISALKTARQNNNAFALCSIQKEVMSLLSLMKLDKVFDIYEDDKVSL